MNYSARLLIIVLFIGMAVQNSYGADTIRVAGSGGMIPLVTELAKAYMAEHKNVVIEINQKSIQSAGGIMGAAEGRLDIGMANRDLKDKEKTLGLQVVEIARVAVVIGVNKGVAIRDITTENLCKIYSSKITTWKDLGGNGEKIAAFTKPDSDATKETLRKKIKCFAELREPESVVVVQTSPEMAKILANRAGSIGFTDAVTVDDSNGAIVALKLEGAAPTPENVRNGKYRETQVFTLVTRGQPAGSIREFIDFVKSPRGAKIIEANKAVVIK
ncbi:MAG: phosphate ABC transporter substrate-binding protein [Nitrospirae bacterium]|nr:phosphate ABC transporter substrate-binding protein [Nitrospirota bacterium]